MGLVAFPNLAQQSTPGNDATPDDSFPVADFELRHLNEDEQSFSVEKLQVLESGGVFEGHVKRFSYRGETYDHPLTVAQYVMHVLNNYRMTGDSIYLRHAEINLDHIASIEEVFDGRGLYPYHYDFAILTEPDGWLRAPWVSGMTQGQVLQVLNRHRRYTGSDKYEAVVKRVVSSFGVLNDTNVYWSPTTDQDGYLWLEEYPTSPPSETLNGHIFAIFGLYEEWLMSQDPWVEQLIKGALTTVRDKALGYRREGLPSRYWVISENYADRYHVHHIAQLLQLYRMTGDDEFARIADIFFDDYQPYEIEGILYLEPGDYEVASLETEKPSLDFAGTETITIDKLQHIEVIQRRRLVDAEEYWYKCTTGPLKGFWIQEDISMGIALSGEFLGAMGIAGPLYGTRMIYSPPRPGVLIDVVRANGYLAEGLSAVFPSARVDLPANTEVEILARELISREDFTLIEMNDSADRYWIPTRHVTVVS